MESVPVTGESKWDKYTVQIWGRPTGDPHVTRAPLVLIRSALDLRITPKSHKLCRHYLLLSASDKLLNSSVFDLYSDRAVSLVGHLHIDKWNELDKNALFETI